MMNQFALDLHMNIYF